MGQITINIVGQKEPLSVEYSEDANTSGKVTKNEEARAQKLLAEKIKSLKNPQVLDSEKITFFEKKEASSKELVVIQSPAPISPSIAKLLGVTITKSSTSAPTSSTSTSNPTSNSVDTTGLKGAPLTKEVLDKIPTNTTGGRFLHWVGEVKADNKYYAFEKLYKLIIDSKESEDMNFIGRVDKAQSDRWKEGKDFPILIPDYNEKMFNDVRDILNRNALASKGSSTLGSELVGEVVEIAKSTAKESDREKGIQDFLRMANDPSQNDGKDAKGYPSGTQADERPRYLSLQEFQYFAKQLGFKMETDSQKKDAMAGAAETLAAYLTIMSYCSERAFGAAPASQPSLLEKMIKPFW